MDQFQPITYSKHFYYLSRIHHFAQIYRNSMNQKGETVKLQEVGLSEVYQSHQHQRNTQQKRTQQMAPLGQYRIDYEKFMNFQKFFIFQTKQSQIADQKPLGFLQFQKINRLINMMYQKYKDNLLLDEDLKGVWAIVSFIFPTRTGLFLNQSFIMLAARKLSLKIYQNQQTKREIKTLLQKTQQYPWFKDKYFIQKMQFLLKQAKNLQKQEKNSIYGSFTKIISMFSQDQETYKYMDQVISEMNNFGVIEKIQYKRQQKKKQNQAFIPIIDGNSIFDANDMYVLSQPDSLVADLCLSFEDNQYKKLKRKMSHNQSIDQKYKLYNLNQMPYEEQTQTQFHQRTANKSTPQKQQQFKPAPKISERITQFKRKIHFEQMNQTKMIQCNFVRNQKNEDQETTVLKRRKINIRPPRQIYMQCMISNHRKIDKKWEVKVNRKKQAHRNSYKIKNKNRQIQKQIRKSLINGRLTNKRQKRCIKFHSNYAQQNNGSLLVQRQMNKLQTNYLWDQNHNFVQNESNNHQNQSIMQIQQDNSSLVLVNNRRRKSQDKNKFKHSHPYRKNQQGYIKKKKRLSDYRKKQKYTKNIDSEYQNEQNDEKTRQKVRMRRQQSEKRIQRQKIKQKSQRKNINSQSRQKDNQRQYQKDKQKIGRRLRRQVEILNNDSKIVRDSQSYEIDQVYQDQMNNNQTINYQRKSLLNQQKDINKVNLNEYTSKDLCAYKYSHLLVQSQRQNKELLNYFTQKSKDRSKIDSYFTKQQTHRVFEPLQRMQIRKLAILEFQQLQQVQERMLIENEQINHFQKMRRQIQIYQQINRTKMNFEIFQYISYLAGLQTKQEAFKQIKKIAEEYLSNIWESNIPKQSKKRVRLGNLQADNQLNLILVSRKIISMYIFANIQLQESNISQGKNTKFSYYSQTYIIPMLKHYIYKILIRLLAQIINALYTSQGDEDFQLLNRASFPMMMLLHDVRSLYQDNILKNYGAQNNLFEQIIAIFDDQSNLVLADLAQSLDQSCAQNKKMHSKLHNSIKLDGQYSNINLPKNSMQLMAKYLKVNLSPFDIFCSTFIASTILQFGLHERIKIISTRWLDNSNTKRICDERVKKFAQKGLFMQNLQKTVQRTIILNVESKRAQKVCQLVWLFQEVLQKFSFQLDAKQRFQLQCRVCLRFVRVLKQIQKGSITINIDFEPNRIRQIQNQKRTQILQRCKAIIQKSVNQYIKSEIGSLGVLNILNKITMQQLKQIKEVSSNILQERELHIHIQINLQISSVMINYQQFRQNQIFSKFQLLKLIQRVLNQIELNPSLPNLSKPDQKGNQMLKTIFNLLLSGYKFQISKKGQIWRNNDQIKSANFDILAQKKDRAQQYWILIRKLFKIIYQKYLSFKYMLNNKRVDSSGQNKLDSLEGIQNRKITKYSNLLIYMIWGLTQNINGSDQKFYAQKSYQLCSEQNCLSFSVRHILVNLCSLYAEYNFFADFECQNANLDNNFILFSNPNQLAVYVIRLIDIQIEKAHRLRNKENEEQLQQDLFQLAMQRVQNKPIIVQKWLTIVSARLKGVNQVYQKIQNVKQKQKHYGLISAIGCFKRLLPNQNNQNQKQKTLNVGNNLFLQYIKKYEHLSFLNTLNNSVSLQKQVKQGQIQDIQCLFQFMFSFSKLTLCLLQSKAGKQNNNRIELLFRKFILQANVNKASILNIISSLLLKKTIFLQSLLEKQKIITVVKLWCRIYQISCINNFSPNGSNKIVISDTFSLLFSVFRSILNKKISSSRTCTSSALLFPQILQFCHKQCESVFSIGQKDKKQLYNKSMIMLIQSLYCYMKSMTIYLTNSKSILKAKNKQFKNEHTYIHTVSVNYLKLFNTVLKWPCLLSQGIHKLKPEFQSLTLTVSNSNANKSLLEGLLVFQDNISIYGGCKQSVGSWNSLREELLIVIESLVYSNKLEANVYSIKDLVPSCLLLYLIRKTVQSQINIKALNLRFNQFDQKKGLDFLINGNRNTDSSPEKANQIGQLELFRSIIDTLCAENSLQKQLYNNSRNQLLQKLLRCFIKALSIKNKKPFAQPFQAPTCGMPNNQNQMKIQTYLFEIHMAAKKSIPEYKQRVLKTFLTLISKSSTYRNLFQAIFEQNLHLIQNYLQQHVQSKDQYLNLQQSIPSTQNPNRINNNPKNNVRKANSIEEILYKFMISTDSDFYLIKKIINSRINKIISQQCAIYNQTTQNCTNLNSYNTTDLLIKDSQKKKQTIKSLEVQIQEKKILIVKALQKAIMHAQTINKNRDSLSKQNNCAKSSLHKCNSDLQDWFKQKILMFRKQIEDKRKRQTQILAANQQRKCNKFQLSQNNNQILFNKSEFIVSQVPMKMQIQNDS